MISAAVGQRIMRADEKAQIITGQAEIDNRINLQFDTYDTNPDESNYATGLKKTVGGLKDIIANTTNGRARTELGQYITAMKPRWDKALNAAVLNRQRINTYARRDQLISGISGMDLSEPGEKLEAEGRVGQGGDLMRELGHSPEEIENWMAAALKDVDNQTIFQQAENILEVQGYDKAIDFVMKQKIDVDSKKGIVSDINFEAAQQKFEYEKQLEKLEQDYLVKLRQEKLSEDEVMTDLKAGKIDVDKAQEWLTDIDARTKERLEGEKELNWKIYDKLQAMVESYDKDLISKDEVRKEISKAVKSRDITTTIAMRLRDRLATKDNPDDPLNKSSAKRALSILNELKGDDLYWPEDIKDEEEGNRQNLLNYLDLTRELEKYITDNPDATDEQINEKVDTLTKPYIEDKAKGMLEKLWGRWVQSLFGMGYRKIAGIEKEGKEAEKSPYPEYPDAFLEDGVWKVIRDGKTYRIE